MSEIKRGRPTVSLREYTLRVRLADEEMEMLDLLCHTNEKSRSEMIRSLIVSSIRAEYFQDTDSHDLDNHVKELLEQQNILSYIEECYPLVDEIDKVKIK